MMRGDDGEVEEWAEYIERKWLDGQPSGQPVGFLTANSGLVCKEDDTNGSKNKTMATLLMTILHVFGIHWWQEQEAGPEESALYHRNCRLCPRKQSYYMFSNYSHGWQDD